MPILNTEKYGVTVYSPQQPHNPMGEVLEWSTDVFTAHDGTEQRKAIRSLPRHVLEMNFPIQAENNGRAINAIYGGVNDDWLVPMWAWARPAGAAAPGATEVIVDMNLADNYVVGGQALLWESADKSVVVEIVGYTAQGIALAAPLEQPFVGAYLVPMRKGRITGTPQRLTTGHNAVLNTKFDVEDEGGTTSIYIAFDCSLTMNTMTENGKTRHQNQRAAINSALALLKDFPQHTFNIMLNGWTYSANTRTVFGATAEDLTSLQGFVNSVGTQYGTDFVQAVSGAADFFAQSTARRIYILTTDGTDAENVATASALLKGVPNVKAYAFNIDATGIAKSLQMDNTPEDSVPVLSGGDPDGLLSALTSAIFGQAFGRYLNADLDTSPIEGSDGSLTEETSADINTIDYDTGKRAYFMPWLNPKLSKTQRVTMLTADEAIGFRAWLQRRAGKLNPFWRPTFENDFRLTSTGLIASTLLVRDDDYNQFGGIRKHIAVRLASGQWLPRTIVSHAGLPNNIVQLNLDVPLNAQAADIVCISYLGLHRLNTDRIEMQWNSGICVSEFTTIEITP